MARASLLLLFRCPQILNLMQRCCSSCYRKKKGKEKSQRLGFVLPPLIPHSLAHVTAISVSKALTAPNPFVPMIALGLLMECASMLASVNAILAIRSLTALELWRVPIIARPHTACARTMPHAFVVISSVVLTVANYAVLMIVMHGVIAKKANAYVQMVTQA